MSQQGCRNPSKVFYLSASSNGFTLVELLIVLAIAAILLLITVPGYSAFVNQTRVDSAKNKLAASIAYARGEAINHSAGVAVCPLAAANNCAAGNDWSRGWAVFLNNDGAASAFNAGNLLHQHRLNDPPGSFTFSENTLIRYDSLGLYTSTQNDGAFTLTAGNITEVLIMRTTGETHTCRAEDVGKGGCP